MTRPRSLLLLFIGATACFSVAAPAAAADVYRCLEAAGKVSFSDKPCPDGTSAKVQIKPNSVGETDQEQLRAKREALDKSINGKIATDDADRARRAAETDRRNARC